MTVNDLSEELAKVEGADRDKDVICQTVDGATFDLVTSAAENEDNFALFVNRYKGDKA